MKTLSLSRGFQFWNPLEREVCLPIFVLIRESLPWCDPPCGLGQGLKTVGFHFTTWPNPSITGSGR
jgi:hypothetical protein